MMDRDPDAAITVDQEMVMASYHKDNVRMVCGTIFVIAILIFVVLMAKL